MHVTTGLWVFFLNSRRSWYIMAALAVTVPPGELIRSTTAFTLPSFAIASSVLTEIRHCGFVPDENMPARLRVRNQTHGPKSSRSVVAGENIGVRRSFNHAHGVNRLSTGTESTRSVRFPHPAIIPADKTAKPIIIRPTIPHHKTTSFTHQAQKPTLNIFVFILCSFAARLILFVVLRVFPCLRVYVIRQAARRSASYSLHSP